jgi:hypothetical protein
VCSLCARRRTPTIQPQVLYSKHPLPIDMLNSKAVGELKLEEFQSFMSWTMQNFINTCNWAKLKAVITPTSEDEMRRLTMDYYRAPPPGYEEFVKVATPTQHRMPLYASPTHIPSLVSSSLVAPCAVCLCVRIHRSIPSTRSRGGICGSSTEGRTGAAGTPHQTINPT